MSLPAHPDTENGKGSEMPLATHPVVTMNQARRPLRASHLTRTIHRAAAVLMDGDDIKAGTVGRKVEEVERQRSHARKDVSPGDE